MGGGRGPGRVARREAGDAVYGIYHAGGLAEVAQDQRAGAGQWRYLGTYAFDPAGSPLVVLAGGSDGTLSADAIRFVGAGPAPADLRFVLGDHLGTPQKLTDNTGALVWDRLQTPFGLDHSVTGPAATPVRFPGQYADSESGLHYNYFRDYDPSLGRYVQSDPIGLAGGLNTYGYVGGNPTGHTDPTGEALPAIVIGAGRIAYQAYRAYRAAEAARRAARAASRQQSSSQSAPAGSPSSEGDSESCDSDDDCERIKQKTCIPKCSRFALPGSRSGQGMKFFRCVNQCMYDFGCPEGINYPNGWNGRRSSPKPWRS